MDSFMKKFFNYSFFTHRKFDLRSPKMICGPGFHIMYDDNSIGHIGSYLKSHRAKAVQHYIILSIKMKFNKKFIKL